MVPIYAACDMTRPATGVFVLLLWGLGVASCKPKEQQSIPGAPGTATATPAPSLGTSASAPSAKAAVSSTTPSPTTSGAATAPADAPRCKALEKGKLVAIGSRTTDPISLEAREGFVYWLGFQAADAKAELVRFGRDGSEPVELGSYRGLGRPGSLVLTKGLALFRMRQTLISIPLAGGEASKLASDFSFVVGANETHAYGVRCDEKGGSDQLVRVKISEGEVEAVASWPHAKGTSGCDYRAVVLDEQNAYVADWVSRRLTAVSLADGSTRQLVERQPWLSKVVLEHDAVVYNSGNGIFRVPKAGGTPRQLTELGGTPSNTFVWDPGAIYVLQTPAHSTRDFISKIPSEGGKGQDIEGFAPGVCPPSTRPASPSPKCAASTFTRHKSSMVVTAARSSGSANTSPAPPSPRSA